MLLITNMLDYDIWRVNDVHRRFLQHTILFSNYLVILNIEF